MESIMESAHGALKADAVQRLSAQIHETPGATERGLESALPVSIAGLAVVASSERSAGELLRALRGGDYPHLGAAELHPTLADPGAVTRLAQSGEGLLSRIFGSGFSGIVDALAGQSGVSRASATKLLGLSAPIVLDIVGRQAASERMDARSFARFLDDQSQTASEALPVSVGSALEEARRQAEAPPVETPRQEQWRPGEPREREHETMRDRFESARGRAGGAFGAARERIGGAMGDVREGAHDTSVEFRERATGRDERRALGASAGLPERRRSLSGMTWLLAALVLVGLLAFLIARARRSPDAAMSPETEPRLNTPEGRPVAPPEPRAPGTPPPAIVPPPVVHGAQPAGESTTAPPESTIGEADPAVEPPAAAPGGVEMLTDASGPTVLIGFLESNEPTPKRFVLEVVDFGTGSAEVEQNKVLDAVADTLRAHPAAKVRLDGHTDAVGNGEANRQLSQRRAEKVKEYLVERGVGSERIEATGKGETEPLDPSASEANPENRRVELVVISR
jgi:OmpA-OmpF porin, OOP family